MRIFKTILVTVGAFRLTLITLGAALRTYTRYATGGEADTAFKKFRADKLNHQAKMMWDCPTWPPATGTTPSPSCTGVQPSTTKSVWGKPSERGRMVRGDSRRGDVYSDRLVNGCNDL